LDFLVLEVSRLKESKNKKARAFSVDINGANFDLVWPRRFTGYGLRDLEASSLAVVADTACLASHQGPVRANYLGRCASYCNSSKESQ
jgi:hypothetical protein